jgi:hypothetical protein
MDANGKRPCPDQRERLIAVAVGDARPDFALDAHMARCSGCHTWLARVEQHIGLLRELPRVPVPSSLDGLAVAATQAGLASGTSTWNGPSPWPPRAACASGDCTRTSARAAIRTSGRVSPT